MNNAITTLTFQNFTFNPVVDSGQIWLTSTELAQALGYSRTDNVSRVYSRNADEFTDSMTMTVNMTVVRKTGEIDMLVRLFSLRGAHLIAMFATTPIAKLFRKWVLDILDRELNGSSLDEHLLLRNITTVFTHISRVRTIWNQSLSPSLRRLNTKIDAELTGRLVDLHGSVFSSLKHLEMHSKVKLKGKIDRLILLKNKKVT
ncbi:MAG: Bro-N domain-containing protein [Candidatus Phlomobacter fragariae]